MDRTKKLKEKVINKLERFLSNLLIYLKQLKNEPIQQNKNLNLVDLTPNDAADNCEVYFEAIEEGLENPKIKNIALTGPYGSGKSSIIKSFEKKYPFYKFLNISLASFKDDTDLQNPEQQSQQDRLIERSIIQQMFYGADSSKLSHSRFKRIKIPNPKSSFTKACLIGVWCLFASVIYYASPVDILKIATNWGELLSSISVVSFLFAIPIVFLSDYLKSQNGFSFKKVSLKNLEIETSESSENSILNRHLDEIIYFFQIANDYDLVVIEDLDRFGSPDIFVKLREINKLINDNDGTNGNIKFLYALKDDMFVHKNRAKFFDLIIPVIPVVNSNNSLDRILTSRLKNSSSDVYEKIKGSTFLRDVSNYLDDMRLIHNIFNEFEIYYNKLKNNTPDPTKLLAVIIYKNVYPNDFESLHHGKGKLAELCHKRSVLLENIRHQLIKSKKDFEKNIQYSDNEQCENIKELITIYYHYISMSNGFAEYFIDENGQWAKFSDSLDMDSFNYIVKNAGSLTIQTHRGQQIRMSKSFEKIESELNPRRTFAQRKLDIENKTVKYRHEINKEIQKIENKTAKLSHLKLAELLKQNKTELDKVLGSTDDMRLLRYLVLDGYLDENYYLYTSNFYEGRKTINDQGFITTVRGHSQPSPTHPINNPKEVCSELRLSDFSQSYILNVDLIDYLVENNQQQKLRHVFQYITEQLNEIENFLATYFVASKCLGSFIKKYADFNPSYAIDVINKKINTEHLRQIFLHVDIDFICNEMNEKNFITNYLNEFLEEIIAGEFSGNIDLEISKRLNLKVVDISLLADYSDWYKYIIDNSLYEINTTNICHLLVNHESSKTSNYTAIQTYGTETLKSYIEKNISIYFCNVFLQLESNTEESETSVIKFLNNENLSDSQKREVILRQSTVIKDCDAVPSDLWIEIAEEEKMAATWKNITKLYKSEIADKEALIKLFNQTYYSEKLSEADWPKNISNDIKEEICSLIYESDDISDKNYNLLTANLPWKYTNFSENVNENKLKILINNKVVSFNADSFEFAKSYDFFIKFILNNIHTFIKSKNEYQIEYDTIKQLLISDIEDEYKIQLIYMLDWREVDEERDLELANCLIILFQKHHIELEKLDNALLQWICSSSKDTDTSIELILKFIEFWDEDETFKVLDRLPQPYCNISNYGKRPKINKTDLNMKFAKALHRRHFISSMPVEDSVIQINTKKRR